MISDNIYYNFDKTAKIEFNVSVKTNIHNKNRHTALFYKTHNYVRSIGIIGLLFLLITSRETDHDHVMH